MALAEARSQSSRRRLREHADRVRDCPIEPLTERLGYRRDPRHRQRWRRHGFWTRKPPGGWIRAVVSSLRSARRWPA